MIKIIQIIIVELLYLTPIGFLLRIIDLIQGKATPGISIHFQTNELDSP